MTDETSSQHHRDAKAEGDTPQHQSSATASDGRADADAIFAPPVARGLRSVPEPDPSGDAINTVTSSFRSGLDRRDPAIKDWTSQRYVPASEVPSIWVVEPPIESESPVDTGAQATEARSTEPPAAVPNPSRSAVTPIAGAASASVGVTAQTSGQPEQPARGQNTPAAVPPLTTPMAAAPMPATPMAAAPMPRADAAPETPGPARSTRAAEDRSQPAQQVAAPAAPTNIISPGRQRGRAPATSQSAGPKDAPKESRRPGGLSEATSPPTGSRLGLGGGDDGDGSQRIVISDDPNHPILLAALIASVLAIALALFALQQARSGDDEKTAVGTEAAASEDGDSNESAAPGVALADVRTFVDERPDAEARDVWLCETHLRLINTGDARDAIESIDVMIDSGGRQRTLTIEEGLVEDKVASGTDRYGWVQAATLLPSNGFGVELPHELAAGGLRTAYLSEVAPLPFDVAPEAITDLVLRVDSNSAWHVPDLEALDAAVSRPTGEEGIPISYLAVIKFADGGSLTIPSQECGTISTDEVAALEELLPAADE